MTLLDMFELGFDNLRRTKLRTALTVLGVVIGIGALTSMVSFGTGMQKNITEAFKENDLFTSLFVTAVKIDVEEVAHGGIENIAESLKKPATRLTDSTLADIKNIDGVEIAFPEISFPVKIRINGQETATTLEALPAVMGEYRPFSELAAGEFFADDSAAAVVLRWETLQRMNREAEDRDSADSSGAYSSETTTVLDPDSIIGSQVEIVSAVLDVDRMRSDPMGTFLRSGGRPFTESTTELRLCGVLEQPSQFSESRFRGGVIVPTKTAERIPRLGFSSVWDLLRGRGDDGTYSSLYVRVKRMADMKPVREQLESMGLNVVSISDELKEIRRAFLIVDSILGAVGTIALVVAALGIANTMVMSILERTREIGIMKAIGGSEGEIRMIFFVEAATIGVIGAAFGLVLGWAVTRVANLVVNAHLMPEDLPSVNMFYFPAWLILGAIAFSIVVSLAAGLYPAVRASRVDPVEALRHD
ncbi:MAG: ABC transporter permease [Candidatus Eisenbacteria bacterium]